MITLYRDGFTVHRWTFVVRRGRVRGLVLGLEWRPGPWRESPATHSSLTIHGLVIRVVIEHACTRVRTKELPLDDRD